MALQFPSTNPNKWFLCGVTYISQHDSVVIHYRGVELLNKMTASTAIIALKLQDEGFHSHLAVQSTLMKSVPLLKHQNVDQ